MQDFCNNQGMSENNQPLEGASALLSFTVENAHSYRDETEFSMVATRLAEDDARRDLKLAGLKNPIGALPVAGIFGANASGKTTILRAMADMRSFVLRSFQRSDGISGIGRNYFALDPRSKKSPSSYAIDLVIDGVRWQYGFEIDDERVWEEYAYHYPKGRRVLLYHRKGDVFKFGVSLLSRGQLLKDLIRDNILLLSVIGKIRDEEPLPLYNWFGYNFMYFDSENRRDRIEHTSEMIQDNTYKSKIMNMIRSADLGVTDIRPVEPDIEANRFFRDIMLKHSGVNNDVELDTIYESNGTKAWIGLIGPVIDAIQDSSVLLVDELGGSLHPDLISVLINIFQNQDTNPNFAQLIFNSHDMTILNRHRSFLGRDQTWFTDKTNQGISTLYRQADFWPRPRREIAPYSPYLKGRYGALPVIDESEILVATKSKRS